PRPSQRGISNRRIFAVEMPLQWIITDILPNAVACPLVADDMLMIAPLPDMATGRCVRGVDGLRRHALVSTDDGRQRLAAFAQFDDTVDVVWHDDEFVER